MPDLPRVTDAPDADDRTGQRQLHPLHPLRRALAAPHRVPAALMTGALVVALSAGLLVSSAQADDLTDRRAELKQQKIGRAHV